MQSYLIGFIFWLGIRSARWRVLMVQHLTGGVVGHGGPPHLRGVGAHLPLMRLLFLPIAFVLQTLYVWATPAAGRRTSTSRSTRRST